MGLGPGGGEATRRFGCTACGRCCDRGPEMELGEAAALADVFVMALVLKVHSIPLDDRSEQAARWWREEGSRIPLRPAFEEKRRHLAWFASRRRAERQNGREIYLTISAIADPGDGACPALIDGRCGIHARRPLTCRTVPLHYSRQPSTLLAYLDRFTATPGYRCDTVTGPPVLDGSAVLAGELCDGRERAVALARADRPWKEQLLALMDDPVGADRAGLPTWEAVRRNSDEGFATLLPMIVAWRVAEHAGLITPAGLKSLCERQRAVVEERLARAPSDQGLRDLLPLYRARAAGRGALDRSITHASSRG